MSTELCVFFAAIVGIIIGMVLMYGIIEHEFYRDIEEKNGDLYDFAQYCRRKK